MKASRMNAPCHKCEERHVGCHSGCERYIQWRDGNIDDSRKAKEQIFKNKLIDDYQIREMMKNRKKGK